MTSAIIHQSGAINPRAISIEIRRKGSMFHKRGYQVYMPRFESPNKS